LEGKITNNTIIIKGVKKEGKRGERKELNLGGVRVRKGKNRG